MATSRGKRAKPFPGIRLSKADRKTVGEMLNRGSWPARVLRRARILQLLDRGWRVSDVKLATEAYPATIRKLGYRYLEGGLAAAIHERPRPGAERRLDKRREVAVVAMVCGSPPEGRARWSVRLATVEAHKRGIANTVGRETIRLVLRDNELKPWRKKNVVRP
jgi:hypothetical protein